MMLSTPELIVIAVALAALVLILTNRLRTDLVALLVLLTLVLTGVITTTQAFSGFSQAAVITIIGLFILTRGLEDTGVVTWLADRLRVMGGTSEARLVAVIMAAGAMLSLAMNNIAAGAVLLPAIMQIARESNIHPSKLLIPLSFGTLVGGMATYFTTANIIMSGLLQAQGQPGLTMADFVPTGGVIVLVTLVYMVLVGRRLLPDRESQAFGLSPRRLSRSLYETYQLEERLWEFRVEPTSQVAHQSLRDSHIGERLGVTVLAIWHQHHAIFSPTPEQVIEPGDVLLILGREDRVLVLNNWGLTLERGTREYVHDYDVELTEVIIPPRSSALGKTLTDLHFRTQYGLTTVALWREGRSYRTDVGKFSLDVGDALLMVGAKKDVNRLAADRNYMVLQSAHRLLPDAPDKALIAVVITTVVLFLSIFDVIPIPIAALAGAVAMALTGCLKMDEAYNAVEWRVIFLIAGMLSLSIGLVETGLSERIGGLLTDVFLPFGGLGMVIGFFTATVAVTQVMGGQVTSLVVGPVAVSAAVAAGVNPAAMAVAVAIGCSTAFLTPVSHPINVLMMGPGGYIPSDFIKVGIGMTVITFITLIIGLIVFWGLG